MENEGWWRKKKKRGLSPFFSSYFPLRVEGGFASAAGAQNLESVRAARVFQRRSDILVNDAEFTESRVVERGTREAQLAYSLSYPLQVVLACNNRSSYFTGLQFFFYGFEGLCFAVEKGQLPVSG